MNLRLKKSFTFKTHCYVYFSQPAYDELTRKSKKTEFVGENVFIRTLKRQFEHVIYCWTIQSQCDFDQVNNESSLWRGRCREDIQGGVLTVGLKIRFTTFHSVKGHWFKAYTLTSWTDRKCTHWTIETRPTWIPFTSASLPQLTLCWRHQCCISDVKWWKRHNDRKRLSRGPRCTSGKLQPLQSSKTVSIITRLLHI